MATSTGQKVLLSCGVIALLAVGGVALMIGGCMKMLLNQPAWAKAEIVNPANKDVTDRINRIIADAQTPADAQAKLAAEPWPAKVVYLAFKGKDSSEAPKVVFQRYTWSNYSVASMNGNGSGTLSTSSGEKEIAIIERSQDTAGGATLNYTLYIEHLPEKGSP